MESPPVQESAETDDASSNYVRNGNRVELRIQGRIDEIHVPAARTADAVQAACKRELDQMRQSFRGLYERLVLQLSDNGDTPTIHRKNPNWDESRDWRVGTDRSLTIAPTEYESVARITLDKNNVSDAAVAEQAIKNEINSRETAIRAVYTQIMRDLGNSRAN
jgi:hypothetical protein